MLTCFTRTQTQHFQQHEISTQHIQQKIKIFYLPRSVKFLSQVMNSSWSLMDAARLCFKEIHAFELRKRDSLNSKLIIRKRLQSIALRSLSAENCIYPISENSQILTSRVPDHSYVCTVFLHAINFQLINSITEDMFLMICM